MKYLLLLLIIIACNNQAPVETPAPTVIVPPVVVSKSLNTPTLSLPSNPSTAMIEASGYIKQYANSDEFYDYVRSNVKSLAGGNETNLETAISKFRACLDKGETIRITWYNYSILYRRTVIGGWDGISIVQNPYFNLSAIERAGHFCHEISHYTACGFTHIDNNIKRSPIITQSFPYVIGNQFVAFLKSKQLSQMKLAGE